MVILEQATYMSLCMGRNARYAAASWFLGRKLVYTVVE